MTPFDLDPYLEDERGRVEAALERAVPAADGAVAEAIRYAVRGGGKRLRPILCVAAYRACRADAPDALYDLAAAIELVHSYSLVHDDLPAMDDDAFRRGRPATHVAHGVAAATLAGAAMIPLAFRTARAATRALGVGAGESRLMLTALAAAAGGGGMVGGQLLDLEAEGRAVRLDELERIHGAKTGALLALSPWLGGVAAGASPLARDALGAYGAALGLAFQIADDILDVTGSTAILGKTAGRDQVLEKATFPGVAGMEAARERMRSEVEVAVAALDAGAVPSDELRALARYVGARER